MTILAIETSCDETGVAIVSGRLRLASRLRHAEGEKTEDGFDFRVLGNVLLSQAALHSEYGGVYPNLAKREHQKNLPILLEQALAQARIAPQEIEAIAVTEGPGLEPTLWTGIAFAQNLAKEWDKPLFGANHMEGHLISSLAKRNQSDSNQWHLENVGFPVLALLVSGGHTQFVECTDWFQYKIIGETLDDAVGECFDKVARMLGLPYPGGPEISRLAREARESQWQSPAPLPRPMLKNNTCDVSFSGLKTAALYALRDLGGAEALSSDQKAAFAKEFEDSVAEVFVAKTYRALRETVANSFVIGGGVAANSHLRNTLVEMIKKEFPSVAIYLPDHSITGDNALMIAEAALLHLLSGNWNIKNPPAEIRADGNLSLG